MRAACALALVVSAWALMVALVPWGVDCAYALDDSSGSNLQAGQSAEAGEAEQSAEEQQAARIAGMAVVKDGLYYLASASKPGFAVSVADESAKAGAKAAPAGRALGNWSQKWLVVQDKSTGYYTLRNMRSRMVLAVAGKAKAGAAVKQVRANAALTQRWELAKEGNRVQFRLASNPRFALALVEAKDGTLKFALQPADAVAEQQFRLSKAEPVEDGHSFFIRSAAFPRKGLAVEGASKKAKAKIVLAKRSSAKAQKTIPPQYPG